MPCPLVDWAPCCPQRMVQAGLLGSSSPTMCPQHGHPNLDSSTQRVTQPEGESTSLPGPEAPGPPQLATIGASPRSPAAPPFLHSPRSFRLPQLLAGRNARGLGDRALHPASGGTCKTLGTSKPPGARRQPGQPRCGRDGLGFVSTPARGSSFLGAVSAGFRISPRELEHPGRLSPHRPSSSPPLNIVSARSHLSRYFLLLH